MIEVSAEANVKVSEYLKSNNEDSAVRIYLDKNGWGGPSLNLALDEPKDTDKTHEFEGITYLIDQDLLDRLDHVFVNFIDQGSQSGFSITASKPIKSGSSACPSTCSC